MKEASSQRKRIVIIDDHALIREGVKRVIAKEPDLEICGEAGTAREGLMLVARTKPHLAIVDLGLPDADGFDLLKDLRTQHPAVIALVCSVHDRLLFVRRALEAGARGYVHKAQAHEAMVPAIRKVLAGRRYLPPAVLEELAQGSLPGRDVAQDPVALLSDRENQVFTLLGEWHTPRQIAEKLGVETSTIEAHRNQIRGKLGLQSSHDLLRYSVGWLEQHRETATAA